AFPRGGSGIATGSTVGTSSTSTSSASSSTGSSTGAASGTTPCACTGTSWARTRPVDASSASPWASVTPGTGRPVTRARSARSDSTRWYSSRTRAWSAATSSDVTFDARPDDSIASATRRGRVWIPRRVRTVIASAAGIDPPRDRPGPTHAVLRAERCPVLQHDTCLLQTSRPGRTARQRVPNAVGVHRLTDRVLLHVLDRRERVRVVVTHLRRAPHRTDLRGELERLTPAVASVRRPGQAGDALQRRPELPVAAVPARRRARVPRHLQAGVHRHTAERRQRTPAVRLVSGQQLQHVRQQLQDPHRARPVHDEPARLLSLHGHELPPAQSPGRGHVCSVGAGASGERIDGVAAPTNRDCSIHASISQIPVRSMPRFSNRSLNPSVTPCRVIVCSRRGNWQSSRFRHDFRNSHISSPVAQSPPSGTHSPCTTVIDHVPGPSVRPSSWHTGHCPPSTRTTRDRSYTATIPHGS